MTKRGRTRTCVHPLCTCTERGNALPGQSGMASTNCTTRTVVAGLPADAHVQTGAGCRPRTDDLSLTRRVLLPH